MSLKSCLIFLVLFSAVAFSKNIPVRPRADSCADSDVIASSIIDGSNLENVLRQYGQALLDAGISSGNNGALTTDQINRFDASNNLLKIAQLIQKRLVFTDSQSLNREQFLEWLNDQSNCPSFDAVEVCTLPEEIICDPTELYRSQDGTCNNLNNPYMGAINTAYTRILPASYNDDIFTLRLSASGLELPNARQLVMNLFPNTGTEATRNPVKIVGSVPNNGAVIYGQTIVHDFAQQVERQVDGNAGPGIQCCTSNREEMLGDGLTNPSCVPVKITKDDAFFSQHNVTCINMVRSQTVTPNNDCSFSAGQQYNAVTAYIDGSFVYGSTKENNDLLRSFVNGALIMDEHNILTPSGSSFIAGDGRVNQTPQLAYFHSIYFREHNRIANILNINNPTWDDERIYQETKRIITAMIQHHNYEEWLPAFLGQEVTDEAGLTCEGLYCDCYSEDVEGQTLNEFTTGISRFFHLFVPDNFENVDEAGNVVANRLSDIFFNTEMLKTEYDAVARGLMFQPKNAGAFPVELINFMFRGNRAAGSDLMSMDIQRNRDHGIPPYTSFREFCNLSPVNSFEDLSPSVSDENIEKLRSMYESVHDIDLYVGAGLENYVGSLTPTMSCFTIEQYRRFKCGDRFFYTNDVNGHPFTEAQMTALKGDSFSRMVCDNTGITEVVPNAFATEGPNNILTSCSSLPIFDLGAWVE